MENSLRRGRGREIREGMPYRRHLRRRDKIHRSRKLNSAHLCRETYIIKAEGWKLTGDSKKSGQV